MWEAKIFGVDIYHLLNWFFVYSFLGWAFESTYVSIKMKKLVNRGFVTGPFCTIYAVGALSVYLVLRPIADNLILLYIFGAVVATAVEYVTALIMESVFHTSWWDYSKNKFNFQGRICLGSSLTWGFFSMIVFEVFQPIVEFIVSLYSPAVGKAVTGIVVILYGIDFVTSFIAAKQLDKKLANMDDIMDEIFEYLQSTKLYATTEEIKDRMEEYKTSFLNRKWKVHMEERIDDLRKFISEKVEQTGLTEKKAEFIDTIQELMSKYEKLRTKNDFLKHRIFEAYPNLKSKNQARIARLRNKSNKK